MGKVRFFTEDSNGNTKMLGVINDGSDKLELYVSKEEYEQQVRKNTESAKRAITDIAMQNPKSGIFSI
ncbi:MAG: hypothetical protein PUG48_05625 [Clostridia bacterium]|nr:hypothetical protein [Clostridia bacterium]